DGEKPNRGVYVYVVAPAIVLTLVARYVVDAYSVRVVIMSAAVSLLLALASRRLFVTPGGTRFNPGRRAAAYWLATAAAILAIRIVATVVAGGAPPLIDDNPIVNLSVALSVIVALGAMFAYFLL